ncbi:MAG: alpha/beta hydrolase [Cyanobacteria bacterium P01_F01_bin.86]
MQRSPTPTLFTPTLPQPQKPLMIFLPGLDGTGKLLAPQVAGLSQYFDLRCLSIPDHNRQNWRSLAETVVELIRREQDERLTYICGESYGGCLALQVAILAPSTLNRLILVNPASSLKWQIWAQGLLQAAPYAPEWLYSLAGPLAVHLLADFGRIQSLWQRAFFENLQLVSQNCVNWRLSMLQNFEVATDQLKRLKIPTALLASGRDRLLPSYKEAQRLHQFLPNSVTYLLPESGHVCLLEESVNLVDCLAALDFLPKPFSIKV